jgi:hypothetical protein
MNVIEALAEWEKLGHELALIESEGGTNDELAEQYDNLSEKIVAVIGSSAFEQLEENLTISYSDLLKPIAEDTNVHPALIKFTEATTALQQAADLLSGQARIGVKSLIDTLDESYEEVVEILAEQEMQPDANA